MAEVNVRLVKTEGDLEEARTLRVKVFVIEQNAPLEEEFDDADSSAVHAVAVQGEAVIGTGRLVQKSKNLAQIGRMAVEESFRRQGVGGKLLRFLEQQAKSMGTVELALHAQTYVTDFYAKHGYETEGDVFMEASLEHVLMRKTLQ